MATRKLNISKEVLQQLRGIQFQPEAPVYEQDEVLVTIPQGSYEILKREIAANGNMKAWTAYEAVFVVGTEEFKVRYRSGVQPDEDGDCIIAKFAANRDFTATSGRVIKKGDVKIFAVNAA